MDKLELLRLPEAMAFIDCTKTYAPDYYEVLMAVHTELLKGASMSRAALLKGVVALSELDQEMVSRVHARKCAITNSKFFDAARVAVLQDAIAELSASKPKRAKKSVKKSSKKSSKST
jgi:antirestriction protein ArdC